MNKAESIAWSLITPPHTLYTNQDELLTCLTSHLQPSSVASLPENALQQLDGMGHLFLGEEWHTTYSPQPSATPVEGSESQLPTHRICMTLLHNLLSPPMYHDPSANPTTQGLIGNPFPHKILSG